MKELVGVVSGLTTATKYENGQRVIESREFKVCLEKRRT